MQEKCSHIHTYSRISVSRRRRLRAGGPDQALDHRAAWLLVKTFYQVAGRWSTRRAGPPAACTSRTRAGRIRTIVWSRPASVGTVVAWLSLGAALAGAEATLVSATTDSIRGEDRVVQWTTAQGLPQNTVTDIVLLPSGELWLATFGGLARFDGLGFHVLDMAADPGLPANRIVSLAATGRDSFVFLTQQGHLGRVEGGRSTLLVPPPLVRDRHPRARARCDRSRVLPVGGRGGLADGRHARVATRSRPEGHRGAPAPGVGRERGRVGGLGRAAREGERGGAGRGRDPARAGCRPGSPSGRGPVARPARGGRPTRRRPVRATGRSAGPRARGVRNRARGPRHSVGGDGRRRLVPRAAGGWILVAPVAAPRAAERPPRSLVATRPRGQPLDRDRRRRALPRPPVAGPSVRRDLEPAGRRRPRPRRRRGSLRRKRLPRPVPRRWLGNHPPRPLAPTEERRPGAALRHLTRPGSRRQRVGALGLQPLPPPTLASRPRARHRRPALRRGADRGEPGRHRLGRVARRERPAPLVAGSCAAGGPPAGATHVRLARPRPLAVAGRGRRGLSRRRGGGRSDRARRQRAQGPRA